MSDEKNKAYEKLTPERKALVDTILQNLEKGDGLWKQGWVNTGVPESAITGKQYHGINNFYLTLISIIKGYSDNSCFLDRCGKEVLPQVFLSHKPFLQWILSVACYCALKFYMQ